LRESRDAAGFKRLQARQRALVGAEIARIEGRDFDAMRLYEQAIHSSRTSGFVHNEALAYERASARYRARGFDSGDGEPQLLAFGRPTRAHQIPQCLVCLRVCAAGLSRIKT